VAQLDLTGRYYRILR